jgi:dihydroxyacetone kinase
VAAFSEVGGLAGAVQKAGAAAEHTWDIEAKAGRSRHVDKGMLRDERVLDPGVWGIKTILEAL